jgi:hypothetical protein
MKVRVTIELDCSGCRKFDAITGNIEAVANDFYLSDLSKIIDKEKHSKQVVSRYGVCVATFENITA